MSGNSFGQLFRLTTAGESHGPAYVGIVDGCPPGLQLSTDRMQASLKRRSPGKNPYSSPRQELDKIEILSGLFSGETTGTPIAFLIRNQDARSVDYAPFSHCFRPGHADYVYHKKYGVRDPRGGGRASARETVLRVAAGSIAEQYLEKNCGIKIKGYLTQIGSISAETIDIKAAKENIFSFADSAKIPQLTAFFKALSDSGDSVGAVIQVVASQVPIGLGAPVFDRLDADIAKAMMSINAVKGVEIGSGFASVTEKGSAHRDALSTQGFLSNNAGGILGGISSGQDIVVQVAFKPTSSVPIPITTCDSAGEEHIISVSGRHDPCVALRAVPIVEAMLALVLMEHFLRDRAQNK